MEIIQIPGYIESEKLEIARAFLVPKQREANGLAEKHIEFSDPSILELIRHYTRESGVRNLEREIASVCRKVAREVVKAGDDAKSRRVTPGAVHRYLGVQRYRYGRADEGDRIGVCTGLAYTEVGGELLQTEVTAIPGKGKLQVTGRLGEVMQESANAALSYVRSRAKQLGLTRDFYSKVITIATAIASALTRVHVRSNVAMTGEITLQGRILPIGGLKEKMIAAHRGGIDTVLIPKENERDLKDIPSAIRRAISVVLVEHMDEVLAAALALQDPEAFLHEGDHSIEDIFEVPRPPGLTEELGVPAGVN
jgi:ATP-dependent Lon protease